MTENSVYKGIDDIVEVYISSLSWSENAKEYEKTLVAVNIRGFVVELKKRINSCDACQLEQFHKCEDNNGGCIRKQ